MKRLYEILMSCCVAVAMTACGDNEYDAMIGDIPLPIISESQMAVELDSKGGQKYVSCNSNTIILATSHDLRPAPYKDADGRWIFDMSKREEQFEDDLICPIIDASMTEYVSVDFEWLKVSLGSYLKVECGRNETPASRTVYLVFGTHYPWCYNNFIQITQKGCDM